MYRYIGRSTPYIFRGYAYFEPTMLSWPKVYVAGVHVFGFPIYI